MTQTSRLVLEIDSRDAEQKADDVRKALGALEAAGLRVKPAMDEAGSGIDGAGTSARKAAGSIDGLADSSSKSSEASRRTAETFGQASSRLLEMAKSSLQASEYIKAMSASTEKAGAAFDVASTKAASLAALAKRLREESDASVGANNRHADSSKKSAAATQEQATALANLLGRIDPVSKKLAELDKQEQELQRHRASGTSGLDTETFKTYQSTIDKNRAALGGFNSDLKQTGVSAAQTQAALRQLPAQFTDIFTSLAGGQNPLMVLIQQGGQIKDSFGGVGATFDALKDKLRSMFSGGAGAAVLGESLAGIATNAKDVADNAGEAGESLSSLAESSNTAAEAAENAQKALGSITPAISGVSIGAAGMALAAVAAAAALGTLIYGYSRGSKEADEYNKSLILTGNYAGTSAGQLTSLALQVSATNGTIGEAAESLAKLASSGAIAGGSFKDIADAAAAMEDATGKSVDATIAEFVKIAKDPVAAAKELNDQYHFLTASVYSQIVALKEQGDTIGAAKLLTDTYAETVKGRSGEITQNLGTIEKAWKGITDEAKKSLDAIKNIGRDDGVAKRIAELTQSAAYARSALQADPDDKDAKKKLAASEKELYQLQLTVFAGEQRNKYEEDYARIQKQAIDDGIKLKAINDANLTSAEKRNKLIREYIQYVAGVRAANPDDPMVQPEAVAKAIQNIKDKNKDPKPAKVAAYQEDAGQKMLDQARQQYAVLQQQNALIGQQGDGTKALGAEAKRLLELEQQIADLKQKKTLTTAQKQILAMADLNIAQQKQNAALEKQNELKKISTQQTQKLLAFQQNLNSQLNLAQSGLDQKLAGAGLGDKALQRLQEQQQIQQSYQSQMDRLTYDYNKSDKTAGSTQLYNQETEALRSALGQRLAMQQGYYVAVDKAQSDWALGASSALQAYAENAKDVASQTRGLFTRAFTNMEDAVVNFVRTGKLSFKDFANGVIEDLIRIQVRQAAAGFLSSAFSAFSGAGAGTAASAGSTAAGYSSQYGFSDGGFTGAGGKFEPKGVVHGGEFVIRKEVVDQPGMREYLERMNSNSNGYADGGYVNPTSAGATTNVTRGASPDGSAPNITQQFNFQGAPDDSTISLVKDAAYQGAKGGYEMVMRDLKQNGPIRQLIARR